jgi:hypothetical protein
MPSGLGQFETDAIARLGCFNFLEIKSHYSRRIAVSREAQRGQDGVDNVKSATARRNPLVRSRRDSTVLTMPPKKSTAVNRAVRGGTQGRL